MRYIFMFVTLVAILILDSSATKALAAECKQISAQIISNPITAKCTSSVNLCTTGIIDGNQGLSGTTFFTADSIADGPTTAPDAPATISFSGLLSIVTDQGTLTTRHTGVFDTSVGNPMSGFFNSFDQIIGGTGRYENADGFLFTGGRYINGQFGTIVVTGEICHP